MVVGCEAHLQIAADAVFLGVDLVHALSELLGCLIAYFAPLDSLANLADPFPHAFLCVPVPGPGAQPPRRAACGGSLDDLLELVQQGVTQLPLDLVLRGLGLEAQVPVEFAHPGDE